MSVNVRSVRRQVSTAIPPERPPHQRAQPTAGTALADGRPQLRPQQASAPPSPAGTHRAGKGRRPLPPLQCPPTALPARRPRPENQGSCRQVQAPSLTWPGGAAQVLGSLCASSHSLSRTPSRDSPGGLVPLDRTPPPEDKMPLPPPPGPAPRSLPQASTPFHLRKEPPPGSLPGPGTQGPPRPPSHPTGGREIYTRRLGGQI